MYCKNCGNEISFDASFCPICGNKIANINSLTCPRCNHIVSSTDLFCKTCGYDLNSSYTPTEIYSVGNLSNGNKSIEEKMINNNDYFKLKPYKFLSSLITLIFSIILILATFLPLFSNNFDFKKQIDLFDFLVNKDLDNIFINNIGKEFSIKYINIISLFKLIVVEKQTAFTELLLNHTGLYVYGLLAFVLTLICIFSIIILIYSIIGLIKKTFNNKIKIFVALIFALSLSLFFSFDSPGIGLIILTLFPFLLIIFYYIFEIISHEKKFVMSSFVIKSILVLLLAASIIFISFGTFNNTAILARIGANKDGYKSSMLTQIILQMVYITDPKYSASITNIYVWLSSISLFASILGLFFITYSLASLLISYSNVNIPFPSKKISIATACLIISLLMDIAFANFVFKSDYALYISTMSQSEIDALTLAEITSIRTFKILPTVYVAIASIIVAEIYSVIASKILVNAIVNANYNNKRKD